MAKPEELVGARGYDAWLQVGRTNLKCHHALNALLDTVNLSLAQHEVLVAIHKRSGLTQKQLSEQLLVVKSNVSALLKKLEQQGLVKRIVDPADARNKHLSLTARGRKLVQKSFDLQNRVVEAMTSVLSDKEIEQVRSMMRRVGASLDELAASEPKRPTG